MTRWSYIITRTIILGLILLGLWIGTDPLTRTLIVNRVQKATQSKVEIGHLRCSFGNHKVMLKDFAVADRHDHASNLLQADMVYLEFDSDALKHRNVVINRAQTSRLMFNTPRTTNGGLDNVLPEEKTPYHAKLPTSVAVSEIGQRWVDQLDLPSVKLNKVENVNLANKAKELGILWKQKLDTLESQVGIIQKQTGDVGKSIESFDGNPLRWQPNTHVIAKIKSDSGSLLQLIGQYETQFRKDITALKSAAIEDAKLINQSTQTTTFDADQMSELLLTELHAEYADQVVDLIRRFRHAMPEVETAYRTEPERGIDIDFSRSTPKPRFLIREAELNGEGRFFGGQFNFAGIATNLTNQPERLEEPTRFELRAQGDKHVILSYEIDRRNNRSLDKLKMGCPEIKVGEKVLGEPNSLLVTLGPNSKLQASVEAQIVDGQLSGTMVFRHIGVALHVDKLNDLAGGERTAQKMNQGDLNLINEFESRIELSGTLDEHQFTATTDLGLKFATAVNKVLNEKSETLSANRQALLDKTISLQIQSFDQSIVKRLRSLSERLQQNTTRVGKLEQIQPSGSRLNQWR